MEVVKNPKNKKSEPKYEKCGDDFVPSSGTWLIEHTCARQKNSAPIFWRRWSKWYEYNPVYQLTFTEARHGGLYGADHEWGGAWVNPVATYVDTPEQEIYQPAYLYRSDDVQITCPWHEMQLVLKNYHQLPQNFRLSGSYKLIGIAKSKQ